MFLDEATITVFGGNGGSGVVSWRREKYVAKGGPDGGNGGKGGGIYILADANTDTLSDYRSCKVFRAENGKLGAGKKMNGRDGNDLQLVVPPGTQVRSGDEVLWDLAHNGDEVLVLEGGRGGFGNAHFVGPTRQRPDFAEKGEPGKSLEITLELKLVADVGIIGFPSVGKSTLISVISSAKPKIADYPFTTLVPNLGVVEDTFRPFVVCDVPGLIEGASEGKGLGHQFLKHIERCRVLLHVLDLSRALEGTDVSVEKLVEDYKAIRNELETYSDALAHKEEIVVLNKSDLLGNDTDSVISALQSEGIEVALPLSAATTTGVKDLVQYLASYLQDNPKPVEEAEEESTPILRPKEEKERMGNYAVTVEDDVIRISGKRLEQFTVMTDFGSQGAIIRFRDVLDKIGLRKEVNKLRKDDSMQVLIGEIDVSEFV